MKAAVVPIKHLFRCKTRLEPVCSPTERSRLTLSMLSGLLRRILHSRELDRVYVITPDPVVGQYVCDRHPEVDVVLDKDDLSLDRSAAFMAEHLIGEGYSSMLFVLGDLPVLNSRDIRNAKLLANSFPVVLMPDRHKTGTNAVFFTPPNIMPTHFGQNSFQLHRDEARGRGIPLAVLQTTGFRYDMDTPEDLQDILHLKKMSVHRGFPEKYRKLQ